MLMIDKSEKGITIDIRGNAPSILAELGVLVEAVQEQIGGMDVCSTLNDPIGKCLARSYLKAMRSSGAKAKEPERKADSAEGKE